MDAWKVIEILDAEIEITEKEFIKESRILKLIESHELNPKNIRYPIEYLVENKLITTFKRNNDFVPEWLYFHSTEESRQETSQISPLEEPISDENEGAGIVVSKVKFEHYKPNKKPIERIIDTSPSLSIGKIIRFGIFFIVMYAGTKACKEMNNEPKSNAPISSTAAVMKCENYLKRNILVDPDSWQYINATNLIEVNNKSYKYFMTIEYRAKNSFGGYVIESSTFLFDEDGEITGMK